MQCQGLACASGQQSSNGLDERLPRVTKLLAKTLVSRWAERMTKRNTVAARPSRALLWGAWAQACPCFSAELFGFLQQFDFHTHQETLNITNGWFPFGGNTRK